MTLDSDGLMLQAGQGSKAAMGELYRRNKARILSFFRHMQAGPELAEDLTQEVFVRIWTKASRYRACGRFGSFLFTIAANVWRAYKRSLGTRRATFSAHGGGRIHSTEGATERAVARTEFREHLACALGSLGEAERMAFVLSEIEGLSYREIAVAMRCSIGTVGSRKTRAVAQLRRLLREYTPEQRP